MSAKDKKEQKIEIPQEQELDDIVAKSKKMPLSMKLALAYIAIIALLAIAHFTYIAITR